MLLTIGLTMHFNSNVCASPSSILIDVELLSRNGARPEGVWALATDKDLRPVTNRTIIPDARNGGSCFFSIALTTSAMSLSITVACRLPSMREAHSPDVVLLSHNSPPAFLSFRPADAAPFRKFAGNVAPGSGGGVRVRSSHAGRVIAL